MSTAQIYQIGMNFQAKKKPDRRNQAFKYSQIMEPMNEIKFTTTPMR